MHSPFGNINLHLKLMNLGIQSLFYGKKFWKIKANWKFGKTKPSKIMFVLCVCILSIWDYRYLSRFLFWLLIIANSKPIGNQGSQTHQKSIRFEYLICVDMGSGFGFYSMGEFNLDAKWVIDPKLLFVGPKIQ